MKSESKKLKDKAWTLYSQYIRRKYSNDDGTCSCYTCGKIYPTWHDLQCGHGISGRGQYILYHETCRPQCYGCNVGRQGNYQVFIPKLIREYGQEQFEQWVALSKQVYKRSIGDYKQLIAELQAQLDEFDEQGKP